MAGQEAESFIGGGFINTQGIPGRGQPNLLDGFPHVPETPVGDMSVAARIRTALEPKRRADGVMTPPADLVQVTVEMIRGLPDLPDTTTPLETPDTIELQAAIEGELGDENDPNSARGMRKVRVDAARSNLNQKLGAGTAPEDLFLDATELTPPQTQRVNEMRENTKATVERLNNEKAGQDAHIREIKHILEILQKLAQDPNLAGLQEIHTLAHDRIVEITTILESNTDETMVREYYLDLKYYAELLDATEKAIFEIKNGKYVKEMAVYMTGIAQTEMTRQDTIIQTAASATPRDGTTLLTGSGRLNAQRQSLDLHIARIVYAEESAAYDIALEESQGLDAARKVIDTVRLHLVTLLENASDQSITQNTLDTFTRLEEILETQRGIVLQSKKHIITIGYAVDAKTRAINSQIDREPDVESKKQLERDKELLLLVGHVQDPRDGKPRLRELLTKTSALDTPEGREDQVDANLHTTLRLMREVANITFDIVDVSEKRPYTQSEAQRIFITLHGRKAEYDRLLSGPLGPDAESRDFTSEFDKSEKEGEKLLKIDMITAGRLTEIEQSITALHLIPALVGPTERLIQRARTLNERYQITIFQRATIEKDSFRRKARTLILEQNQIPSADEKIELIENHLDDIRNEITILLGMYESYIRDTLAPPKNSSHEDLLGMSPQDKQRDLSHQIGLLRKRSHYLRDAQVPGVDDADLKTKLTSQIQSSLNDLAIIETHVGDFAKKRHGFSILGFQFLTPLSSPEKVAAKQRAEVEQKMDIQAKTVAPGSASDLAGDQYRLTDPTPDDLTDNIPPNLTLR